MRLMSRRLAKTWCFWICITQTTWIHSAVAQDATVQRIDSEFDESSCLCGLNREIMNKLEALVLLATKDNLSCAQVNQTDSDHDHRTEDEGDPVLGLAKPESEPSNLTASSPQSNPMTTQISEPPHGTTLVAVDTNKKPPASSGSDDGLDSADTIIQLMHQINHLQQQIIGMTLTGHNEQPDSPVPSVGANQPVASNLSMENARPIGSIIEPERPANILEGLAPNPVQSENEALMKLNQSQKVNPQEMAAALQSTVPNVVSNLFSNIQQLTAEAEQENQSSANHGSGTAQSSAHGSLSSIDGSSVSLENVSSADEIISVGERLFLQWIEHQLRGLHLTTAMANYIRESAVNMFSKVLRQYVERVQRLGGAITENVLKATQMALSNTQTIISFLLRNYLNYSAGFMRIIGESMSRVGKQIDMTGESIAHISLNPFDIVSTVIDTLPNPRDYSQYFRAFGKQLMGGEGGDQTDSRPQGILLKTMGALGKTLSSLVG